MYKLYPIEVIFPSLEKPWVSDGHIPPNSVSAIFYKCLESEEIPGQVITYKSSVKDIALKNL